MRLLLFLTLIIVLSVTSCEKDCIRARMNFGLIGFTEAEADTIIIRRFIDNNSTPFDTVFANQLGIYQHGDTLDLASIPAEFQLESSYRYEIFLPGADKIFAVSAIQESNETSKRGLFSCTKEACVNSITSYTVNGQPSTNILGGSLTYFKK